jgi:hypothetical protein
MFENLNYLPCELKLLSSMAFELSGKLFLKEDTVVISDRFKKREFVLIKEENNAGTIFTDYIKFQLTQDRCNLIDGIQVHDDVKVQFNIKGSKWEKNGNVNYFNNLDAWRVEKVSGNNAASGASDVPSFQSSGSSMPDFDSGSDDLPF